MENQIVTHKSRKQREPLPTHARIDEGVELSAIKPRSVPFKVVDKPLALIAWDMPEEGQVLIHRTIIRGVGNVNWLIQGCGVPVAPDISVPAKRMPYYRKGKQLVLNKNNPHCIIDDVGTFFLEYIGRDHVFVELLPDVIFRKCHCKE